METPAPAHIKFAVLAADVALFTIKEGRLLVRLIRVKRPPHYPNNPGLPGGLLHPKDTADEAAVAHVEEKAHIDMSKAYIEQLYTFSEVDRDPRGRVVAVAYSAYVPWEKLSDAERADTPDSWWAPVAATKKLAYDHDEILAAAVERLRSRAAYTTLIQKLMPKEFTLTELEQAYESVVATQLDKRNFRKKILKLGVLSPLPHKKAGRFRPAQLYKFASPKVVEIEVL